MDGRKSSGQVIGMLDERRCGISYEDSRVNHVKEKGGWEESVTIEMGEKDGQTSVFS